MIIILIIIMILLEAYFAGTETAIISASEIKLRAMISKKRNSEWDKKIRRVLFMMKNTDKVLSALLVGTNICIVTAASLSSMLFIKHFGTSGEYYSTLVITTLILIFGEIFPKSIFRKIAEPVLIKTVWFLEFVTNIFFPVVSFIVKITHRITSTKGTEEKKNKFFLTKDDLKSIFNITANNGVIKEFDKKILYSVFDFGTTYAREIMVPLIDIILIRNDKKVIDVITLSEKTGFSKIPVFAKQVYNIIGYINVNNLFKAKSNENLAKYIEKAYYVPESKKIDDLFVEMNKKKLPVVFIVDEYGGVSGLITLEDIVEEIVGEIEDESNYSEEEAIKTASKYEWVVTGGVDIDDLFNEIGLRLPKRGFETIAGFIEYYLGRIPRKNDSFIYNNFKFTVLVSTNRSVEKIKIIKIKK